MSAALLYGGSCLGLLLLLIIKWVRGQPIPSIPKAARWRFVGAVVAGGVVSPVLMVLGLRLTTASTASLLLNIEGVFTALVAWLVFRENAGRRVVVGMATVVVGGVLLSIDATDGVALNVGALLIVGACLGWAIDNNLTQAASSADPVVVAALKGFGAAAVNGIIAVALGQPVPPPATTALTMLVGFAGYGLSLALFVVGLRHLGTARTGAYFGLAPFVGAAISIAFFGEVLTGWVLAAGALMALGLWLHLSERHDHEHVHDGLEHEHHHTHDAHHQHLHEHGETDVDGEGHSHWHRHEAMTHSHPHAPDLHHRHSH